MKNLKKFVCIIAIVCMLALCFTGCNEANVSGFSKYSTALTKTEALKTIDTDMDMKMSISMAGQDIDMDMSGNIKLDQSTDKPIAQADMVISAMGTDMDSKVYYADGYMYTEVMGMKMKMESTLEEALGADTGFEDFKEDDIISSSEEEKDGVFYYTVKIKGDSLKDEITDQLDSLKDQIGGTFDEFNIADVDIVIGIKDGYLVSQTMKTSVTGKLDVQSTKI